MSEEESEDQTELVLQAQDEKEVKKRSADGDEGDSYFHTKLKAKNSETVEWIKIKTDGENFCEPNDEFKLKGIEGQKKLEDLVEDNDVEAEIS